MALPSKPYVVDIDTKRSVIRLSGLSPNVGLESNDPEIKGFTYDLKAWEATPVDETQEPFITLPRYLPKPLVGIPESYYQSGIQGEPETATDLELQRIELESFDYRRKWLPKLWHGFYYLSDENHFLFSDESVVQNVDYTDNRSGRNYLLLDKVPKASNPLLARMYIRDDDWVERIYRDVKLVTKFSGIAEDGEELETESSTGEIDWDNVEENIPETLIFYETDTPSLIFNNDWTKLVGAEASEYAELADCENLGLCNGEGNQRFYTKYFPIQDNAELHVYLVDDSAEEFTEWTRVSNFDASGPIDEHFIVDEDYGIIQFGDGTNGEIPAENFYVFVTYRATLRVEYEEEGTTDLCTGLLAEVNPVAQSLNHGFITVNGYDDEPDTITLEADPLIVEMATDLSFLTATVLSRSGRPCRDIDVYFEFVDGDDVGSIGGIRAPGSFLGRTNAAGLARTYYRPPSSIEDMTWYTSTISTSGMGLVLPLGAEPDPFYDEHIYTYAIYRDDPMMGKAGADTTIGEVAWTTTPRPNGRKVILYEVTTSGSWKDPITGVGASGPNPIYRPLRPGSFDLGENSLEYTVALTPPETGDTVTSTWIGGYAVVASRSVTLRAYCFSRRLNTNIYSNEVTLSIILPERMRGTYIEAGDKANIPFGWRLYDADYTIASAITAGTYLGINPRAGAYPIIDVIGGETWDGTSPSDSSDEAEYTFGRLHIVFEVT